MKRHARRLPVFGMTNVIRGISSVLAVILLSTANGNAQQRQGFFSGGGLHQGSPQESIAPSIAPDSCTGRIGKVTDVAYEGEKTTGVNYAAGSGGGQMGYFDPIPVLTATVTLLDKSCLNAHLSAIVGSSQTYSTVSEITLFQVTLTPLAPPGPPIPMVGHYPTPYGLPDPAIALTAEYDVDMLSANFFQQILVGTETPPGAYTVNVWWAGGPPFIPGTGAIGAGFVLKLYQR